MGEAFLMGQSGGITIKDKVQSYFTTFIERTHPTSNASLASVCYGNGLFVAMGDKILTSPDGITWTERTNPMTGFNVRCVTYGNSIFVGCESSYGRIITSPDGINWTERNTPVSTGGGSPALNSVCYASGLFVIVGYSGTILTSPDGIAWTKRAAPNTDDYDEVSYVNNKFVITGTSGKLITSTNGTAWTLQSVSPSKNFNDVCYGNGKYVGVTRTSSLISADLVTWTDEKPIVWHSSPPSSCPSPLYTIKYFDGFGFVALGAHSNNLTGSFFVSPDGINWESRLGGFQKMIYPDDICYGNGKLVLCGMYYTDITHGIKSSYIATLTL